MIEIVERKAAQNGFFDGLVRLGEFSMKIKFLICQIGFIVIAVFILAPEFVHAGAKGECINGFRKINASQGLRFSLSCNWLEGYEESYVYFILPDPDSKRHNRAVLHYEYQSYYEFGDLLQGSVDFDNKTGQIKPNKNTIITPIDERIAKIIEFSKQSKFPDGGLLTFPMRQPKDILKVTNIGPKTLLIEAISSSDSIEFIVFNFKKKSSNKTLLSWIQFSLTPSKQLRNNKSNLEIIKSEIELAAKTAAINKFGRDL